MTSSQTSMRPRSYQPMTSTLKSNHHRPIDQMIRSTPKRARNFCNPNQQSDQSSSTLSCSVILVRRAHRKFHHRIGSSQASLAPMTTSWLICPLSRALDLRTQKKLHTVALCNNNLFPILQLNFDQLLRSIKANLKIQIVYWNAFANKMEPV